MFSSRVPNVLVWQAGWRLRVLWLHLPLLSSDISLLETVISSCHQPRWTCLIQLPVLAFISKSKASSCFPEILPFKSLRFYWLYLYMQFLFLLLFLQNCDKIGRASTIHLIFRCIAKEKSTKWNYRIPIYYLLLGNENHSIEKHCSY